MTWSRYKLNYAFNTGDFLLFKGVKSSSEVLRQIEEALSSCTRDTLLHQTLKIFVTSEDKNLVQGVKDRMNAIANEICGESRLDSTREAIWEAIDINIVYQADLSRWDYSQWTLKENIESSEEALF